MVTVEFADSLAKPAQAQLEGIAAEVEWFLHWGGINLRELSQAQVHPSFRSRRNPMLRLFHISRPCMGFGAITFQAMAEESRLSQMDILIAVLVAIDLALR